MAKERNTKTALERELTITIQEANSSPQEAKSLDAIRALIRRWRLIAFGNRGPAFRYSDFDIRLPSLASGKYVTLREESRMRGAKSKRGAALIEKWPGCSPNAHHRTSPSHHFHSGGLLGCRIFAVNA
jgi:hypothetical protein